MEGRVTGALFHPRRHLMTRHASRPGLSRDPCCTSSYHTPLVRIRAHETQPYSQVTAGLARWQSVSSDYRYAHVVCLDLNYANRGGGHLEEVCSRNSMSIGGLCR
jgi:hypothetical protein